MLRFLFLDGSLVQLRHRTCVLGVSQAVAVLNYCQTSDQSNPCYDLSVAALVYASRCVEGVVCTEQPRLRQ